MQINYNPVGGAGSYQNLMNVNNGDTIEKWNPDMIQRPQLEDLASNVGQGASILTNTLGNIRVTHSWKICKNYTDVAAALTASRTLPTVLLNLLINIQVIETNGATPETQYYPSAVFTRARPDVEGSAITWYFDLTSQFVTATPPS